MAHVPDSPKIPFFGARKYAAGLAAELQELRGRCLSAEEQLRRTGGMGCS